MRRARHWIISDGAGGVEEVRGDAVVGAYPILVAGGPPFVYQSCTKMANTPGRMEGSFTFVEGTIARPTGPEFEAACAPFTLAKQDYIF